MPERERVQALCLSVVRRRLERTAFLEGHSSDFGALQFPNKGLCFFLSFRYSSNTAKAFGSSPFSL